MSLMLNLENLDIETQIEFLCIDAINLWRNKLGNLAKEYNLSRLERRIILFIGRHPSIRQAELAEIMDVEPQSLTRVLESIEKKLWLTKNDDVNDKRAKCLNLTEEGRKKLEDVLKMSEKIRPKILENVSQEEKDSLVKALTKMKENLKSL